MNRAFANRAKSVIGRSASEHAANDAAHDPADEGGTGIRATTATLTAAATATTSAAAARRTSRLFVGVVAGGGWGGCDDFRQQRLVLQPVEVAGLGVTARQNSSSTSVAAEVEAAAARAEDAGAAPATGAETGLR